TVGRALEKLNFAWFEEPMMEDSAESYAWLAGQLDIPVLGPESLGGKHLSRASWVKNDVCDILRAGVAGVGGIAPCLKVAHMAEA
ncbi:enolase C-terminal domain-like protein, partial [Pseudomonas syringae]